MATWRVQLKPDSAKGISYKDLLEFCKIHQIIGVGWYLVEGHTDDYAALRNEVYSIEEYKGGESRALRAVNAIREMKPGDLVWTRVGGDASEYYLCRVGDLLWKVGLLPMNTDGTISEILYLPNGLKSEKKKEFPEKLSTASVPADLHSMSMKSMKSVK